MIRKRLVGRTSSVFSVPCRDAVYADSYEQACRINQRALGKKLSLQSWYICPKIREVDQALRAVPSWQRRIYEAHPELCFFEFAGRLFPSKKTTEGQADRLRLITDMESEFARRYAQALIDIPRKLAARDDILDAMILTVTGLSGFRLLRGDIRRDDAGLSIRIAVPG